MLGAMRHGQGMYKDSKGSMYQGSWKYDQLEGRATAKMPDSSTYQGDWVAGNPHGCVEWWIVLVCMLS